MRLAPLPAAVIWLLRILIEDPPILFAPSHQVNLEYLIPLCRRGLRLNQIEPHLPLSHMKAAVDLEDRTGDVTRLIAGEKHDCRRDLRVCPHPAQRNAGH